MKPSALDVIVCPVCHADLAALCTESSGREILEGQLECTGCQLTYPITRGIPRFVPTGQYAESFGRQWHWFRTVQLDSSTRSTMSEDALRETTGWTDEQYRDSVLLDAGVGAGRYAERAAMKGAEVYGVDLTVAVDAAYKNIGHLPNVHLAQADIFALPFRPGTFDLAYSIGVLHHTPNPREAFRHVASTVRVGGKCATYIYARYGPQQRFSDAIRTLTTKLPLRAVWALSAAAVPLYFLHRAPAVGGVLRTVLPISMERNWRCRWLDTFDWYSPRYQFKFLYPDVFTWFRENGFEVTDLPGGPIRVSGRKKDARTIDHRASHSCLVAS